jgi:hypothetical protein
MFFVLQFKILLQSGARFLENSTLDKAMLDKLDAVWVKWGYMNVIA